MIEHGGLFSVLSFSRHEKGFWGFTPRHAQTVGDSGFAMQNTAPLSSGRIVPRVTIGEQLHSSHVRDLMSNTSGRLNNYHGQHLCLH